MLKRDQKIGLTVQKNGNSKQVTILSEWAHDLDLEEGDLADATYDREERCVKFFF